MLKWNEKKMIERDAQDPSGRLGRKMAKWDAQGPSRRLGGINCITSYMDDLNCFCYELSLDVL